MNQMNEIEHVQAGNQVELVKYRTVNPKDGFSLDVLHNAIKIEIR